MVSVTFRETAYIQDYNAQRQVYNPTTTDFKIGGFPAHFLFAGEDGTISGWYTGTTAQLVVNNSASGNAVYKGIALASAGGADYLYVANFHNGYGRQHV